MTPEELDDTVNIKIGDDILAFVRDHGWITGELLGIVDEDRDIFVIQRDGRVNPTRVYVDHLVLLEKAAS